MRFDFALAVNIAQLAGTVVGGGQQQSSAPAPPSTSEFRTANYITHGLPQQCLPSPYKPRIPVSVDASNSAPGIASEEVAQQKENKTTLEGLVVTVTEVREVVSGSGSGGAHARKTQQEQYTSTRANKSPSPIEDDNDIDSPLDTAHFLSFDEWREQNLAKAGQSSEDFEHRGPREQRQRAGAGLNMLDTLGEDGEIELDFGSDGAGHELHEGPQRQPETPPQKANKPEWQGRSKMAGKTGKERFNYASFDCAATVHKTNREVKGASAILSEHKDSYMLNECRAENKFVIVELCDDILVDTVVLANYEFFSSMFRTFRVSVSAKYPVKASGWKELGVFEARNSREIQAFLVENPLIWARYLKIDFLTHYGNEFYCPVSLLRIHGTTMIEEYRVQEEAAIGLEDDIEDEVIEEEEEVKSKPASPPSVEVYEDTPAKLIKELVEKIMDTGLVILGEEKASPEKVSHSPTASVDIYMPALAATVPQAQPTGLPRCSPNEAARLLVSVPPTCAATYTPSPTVPIMSKSSSSIHVDAVGGNETKPKPTPTGGASASAGHGNTGNNTSEKSKIQASSSSPPSSNVNGQKNTAVESAPSSAGSGTPSSKKPETQAHQDSHSTPRYYSSPTTQAQPTPTTQESFYKHMLKRLQFLEQNATLSLQYIEDQSRILRDAFAKVEKRQNQKQTAYMEAFNATLQAELSGYRQQYDQLWQSTVIELESQRRQSETEILAVSSRLALLADEVIYQKRMSYVQSLLLLVCIALVIFTKSSHLEPGSNGNMNMPFLHSVRRGRAGAALRIFESPPNSPQQKDGGEKSPTAGDGQNDGDEGEEDGEEGQGGSGSLRGGQFPTPSRERFRHKLFSPFIRRRPAVIVRRDSMDSLGGEGVTSPTSPTATATNKEEEGGYYARREREREREQTQSPDLRPQSPVMRSSPATPTGTRGRVGEAGGGQQRTGEAGEEGVNEDSWKVFGPNSRVAELKAAHARSGRQWKQSPSPLRRLDGAGGGVLSSSSGTSGSGSGKPKSVRTLGEDGSEECVVYADCEDGVEEYEALDVEEEDEDEGERKGWEFGHARRKSEPAIRNRGTTPTTTTREGGLSSPPPSPPLMPSRGGGVGGIGGMPPPVGSDGSGSGNSPSPGSSQQQQQQQQHGGGNAKGHTRNGSRGSGGGGGAGGGGNKKKKGKR
ncbi:UNC-like C-terminal-domain-containing protein [Peziza echinospora]|nr:UNC-like C-terminal-domain-containing protein [Peziza echinospora]